MGKFLELEDYKDSKLSIATDCYDEVKLQATIDCYEEQYLQDLLGCELYEEFIANLSNGLPQSDRFKAIYNPFCKDYNGIGSYIYGYYLQVPHSYFFKSCRQVRSEGIKEMLKVFIYWEYLKAQRIQQTVVGNVKAQHELSERASFADAGMYSIYNKAITNYNAIQFCICRDENGYGYSKFNGTNKRKASII